MRKSNRLLFYEIFKISFNNQNIVTSNLDVVNVSKTPFYKIYKCNYNNEDQLGLCLTNDILYKFDKNQKLNDVICYEINGEISLQIQFEYDTKNRLILQKGWSEKNKEMFEYAITYYDKEQKQEIQFKCNEILIDTETTCFKDDKIQTATFNDEDFNFFSVYKYNDLGELTEVAQFENLQLTNKSCYYYQENGLVEIYENRNAKDEINFKLMYFYDEKKQLKREVFENADSSNERETIFEYDMHNHLIKKTIFNNKECIKEEIRRELNYDANGNWIKIKHWLNNAMIKIEERKIHYKN
jgi:hypothetical protein